MYTLVVIVRYKLTNNSICYELIDKYSNGEVRAGAGEMTQYGTHMHIHT